MANNLNMPKTDQLIKIWSDIPMFFKCISRYGFFRTITLIKVSILYRLCHFEGRKYDAKYQVETNQLINLEDLTTSSGDTIGTNYVGASPFLVRYTIGLLPVPPKDLVFVEIGCGTGRAVMLAAEAGFKRIIGWDIAKELIDTGRANLESFRKVSGNKVPIELQLVDATKAPFPDEACVLYFFSPPYPDPVLQACLRNAHQSYLAKPRDMFIILINDHNRSRSTDYPYLSRVVPNTAVFKSKWMNWMFSANVYRIT